MPNRSIIPSGYRRMYVAPFVLLIAVGWFGAMEWNTRYQRTQIARDLTQGDPTRAPIIMRRYGCAGCHTIPGLAGADGKVGVSLAGIRQRVYVGGVVNNTTEHLVQWIVSPQSLSPRSAMPTTGISENEARHVVAYLYSR